VEEHQYLQKKIESAQKTSEIYNVALLSLIRKLKSAEEELENVLSNAKIKLKSLKDANQSIYIYFFIYLINFYKFLFISKKILVLIFYVFILTIKN